MRWKLVGTILAMVLNQLVHWCVHELQRFDKIQIIDGKWYVLFCVVQDNRNSYGKFIVQIAVGLSLAPVWPMTLLIFAVFMMSSATSGFLLRVFRSQKIWCSMNLSRLYNLFKELPHDCVATCWCLLSCRFKAFLRVNDSLQWLIAMLANKVHYFVGRFCMTGEIR